MIHRPFILAASVAALLTHSATAQTATGWIGTGPDSLWSTSANWSNGAPPGGDTNTRNLLFGNAFITAGGAGSLIANNDLVGYQGFRITFEDTAAPFDPAFTITGNAFTLFDFGGVAPRIENQSGSLQTIALSGALTLNGGTLNFAEINPVNGGLSISNAVALATNTQLRIYGDNGHTVTFGGVISGTGNTVAINQNSNVVYTAANTYTGDTFINAGSLSFAQGGSATSATLQLGDTTGTAAARLQISDLDGGTTINRPIVVRAGSTGTKTIGATNTSGTNTFSGTVALNDHLTADVVGGGGLTMSGVISGANSLTKTGNGLLTLSANHSFTGGLVLNGGTTRLTVANSISGGIKINAGATLDANTAGADNTVFNNFIGAAGNHFTFDGGTLRMSAATTGNVDRTLSSRNITVSLGGATIDTVGAYTDFNEGIFNQLRFNTASVLSGTGTLTKNGGGRLQLQNGTASGFTGAVVINNGTLEASGTALGNASLSNTVTINGGNWALSGDASQAITLNGGAVSTNGGSRTINGAINVTAGSYIFLNEFWRNFDSASPASVLVRNLTVNGVVSGDDPLGIAVNRADWTSNNGAVILKNAGNTYSGTITVGKNLRLESNPTGGVGSTLGTAPIILAGGSLTLRDNGTGSGGQLTYGNDVTVTDPTGIFDRGTMAASVTIDVNRASGTNTNNIIKLGSLSIGNQSLNVIGGNGYGLAFTEPSQLTGNATFNVNGASLTFTESLGQDVSGRSLTKNGNAALIFGNTVDYTGATVINAGSLVLNEMGRLTATSAVSLGGNMSLVIDNTVTTVADRLVNSAPITMNGASLTLLPEVANVAGNLETVGAVTLTGGTNTITVNGSNPIGAALTLASLTRQGTATVNFVGTNLGQPGATSFVIITGQTASPFLGAWATAGGEFAAYDTTTGVTTISSIDDPLNDSGLTAADHLRLVGSDLALTANRSVNTVTFGNTSNGRTLDVGANTLTLAAGGILVATNSAAINGTGAITAETPDLIITNNAALNIPVVIKDNGANSVSILKAGTGTLSLSGANTFTGNILIAQGTLALSDVNDVETPGSLGLNANLTLSSGAQPTTLQLTGPSDSTNHNLIIGTPGATVDVTTAGSNYQWTGSVIGGSLTKAGPGTLTLGSAVSLNGNVTANAGTLAINGTATVLGDLNVANGTGGTVQLTTAGGGSLSVGSGSANLINIGYETNGNTAANIGIVDLSGLSSFTANVGSIRIGGEGTGANGTGANTGTLILAQNNTIVAPNSILVADSPGNGDGGTRGTLTFGNGTNDVTTALLTIGGRKYSGVSTIAAGGTLILDNGANRTTLNVGANTAGDTGTTPVSSFDLSGGTLVANLSNVNVGIRSGGGASGDSTGTLNLGSSASTNVNINVAAGIAVRVGGLDFTSGASPRDEIATGTMIIGGGNVSITSTNTGSSAVVIGHFNGTATVNASDPAPANAANGVLTINGGNVTITSAGTTNAVNLGARTIVAGSAGTNTATGTLNINGGSLTVNNQIAGNSTTTESTSNLNLTGGLLNMQGKNISNINNLTFSGGTLKDLGTLNRSLAQTGENSLLEVAQFNTTISNSGTYTVTDGNVNVASGRTLSVPAGTTLNGTANMIINGTLSGALTVSGTATVTATIGGSGTVGVLNLAGGTIAPGNSPGILNTGNLTLGGGNLALEFNSSTVGTGYDQINVTGTVTLSANTNLSLSFGYIPAIGDKFTIINNDLADVLTGGGLFTYNNGAGIADDSRFTTVQGFEFELNYNDGNDVTLTTIVPEPASAATLLAGLGVILGTRRSRRRE